MLLDLKQRVTNAHAGQGELFLRDVEDAVPYNDVGQNAFSILRTDRDKISAWRGVIVLRQANLLSFRQILRRISLALFLAQSRLRFQIRSGGSGTSAAR